MGLFSSPDIPDPVKPRDFTGKQRDRYNEIASEGDPLRQVRDRAVINRLLTNADTEITGPTAASTLAFRQDQNEAVNEQISNYMLQSDVTEARVREDARDKSNQLYAQRQRDLDEYEQQKAKVEAMREIQKKNKQMALLRTGIGLGATIIGGPAGGAVAGMFTGKEDPQMMGLSEQDVSNYEVPGVDYGGFGPDTNVGGFEAAMEEGYDPLTDISSFGF